MGAMPSAGDLFEFLKSLVAHEAEFLVVGAHAVGFHGHPRSTGDLDIWVKPSAENALRVGLALEAFGFQLTAPSRAALVESGSILRMGYAPLRIEVMTSVSGVEFDACILRAVRTKVAGIEVPIIGLDDLITNKRAAGRAKDLVDALELERLRDRRSG